MWPFDVLEKENQWYVFRQTIDPHGEDIHFL